MENANQLEGAGSERDDRLLKLAELKNLGIATYPAKVKRDKTIAEVLADFDSLAADKQEFYIAGRLRAKREHGNLAFANLEDASGNLQLAFSKKDLGADSYKIFIKLIDTADFIQAKGYPFLTHKGEKSLFVTEWQLLTKALRPIPDAWYGLKDEEDRLRKRYLDILLNPELRAMFYKKSLFWEVTRDFMKRHGFFEVETRTCRDAVGAKSHSRNLPDCGWTQAGGSYSHRNNYRARPPTAVSILRADGYAKAGFCGVLSLAGSCFRPEFFHAET